MGYSLEREITGELIDARLDLGVDFLGIAINTSETSRKEIKWLFASGNRNNRYQKIVLQVGKGIAGIVWKTGRLLQSENLSDEMKGALEEFPIAITENLVTVIAVPLLENQEVRAILLGGYRKETSLTSDMEAKMFHAIEQLAPHLLAFINRRG